MGAVASEVSMEVAGGAGAERRTAPRFTSLIRAAKLVCSKGEFVCVVRDVSAGGVGLRCFHELPRDTSMALELQNGESFEIEWVRGAGTEASFAFATGGVEVERLVRETWLYPKRPLRLSLAIPVTLRLTAGCAPAVTQNLSQQGCRVETSTPLALAQPLCLEGRHLPAIRAKVRWRRDGHYGLAFDDTFSLRDFALHAARLQCPSLVTA